MGYHSKQPSAVNPTDAPWPHPPPTPSRPVFPREQPRTPSFHTSSKKKDLRDWPYFLRTWMMGPEHMAGHLPPSMYTCRIISTSSLPSSPTNAPPLHRSNPSATLSPNITTTSTLHSSPSHHPSSDHRISRPDSTPILSLVLPRCSPSSGCPRPLVECPPSNSNTPKPHHRAAIQSRASPQQPCLPSPELLEQSSGETSSSMPATLDTPVLTVDVGLIHKVDTRNVENLFSMWTGELPACTGSAP